MSAFVNYLLVSLVVLASVAHQVEMSAIEEVFQQVDKYARGMSTTSKLTFDQIDKAYDEWEQMPKDVKEKAKSVPLIKLTIDFVINPIGFAGHQIEHNEVDIMNYIRRAEKAYKLFRPGYLGQQMGNKMVRADKFFKILRTAEGKKPRSELTIRDFIMAKGEYEGWLAMLEEDTTYEEIYSKIPELKKIFTYLNDNFVKALSTGVFPHVKKDANPEALLEMFINELKTKHFIAYQDGRWVFAPSSSSFFQNVIKAVKGDDTPLRDEAPTDDESVVEPIVEMADDDDEEGEEGENIPELYTPAPRKGGWRLSAPEDEAYL